MAEQSIIVTVSRRIAAPPEAVFDAWLDAKIAGRFLFATPGGEMVVAETDPRVGGVFRFTDRREGEDVEHVGEYLELDRPRRLVFAFSLPAYSPHRDVVAVDIWPANSHSELTLRQELSPRRAEWSSRIEQGWRMIVDGLAWVVSGQSGDAG